jgi:hypothetical protein
MSRFDRIAHGCIIERLKRHAHMRTRVTGKAITQILYRRLHRTPGRASLQAVQRPIEGGREICSIAIIVIQTKGFDVEIEWQVLTIGCDHDCGASERKSDAQLIGYCRNRTGFFQRGGTFIAGEIKDGHG